jgi:hypothetical protein
MASEPDAVMPAEPVASSHAHDLSPEQRRDVSIAKGVEDDRKFKTRALIAATAFAVLTDIGLYLFR